jgi:hypothetical protein
MMRIIAERTLELDEELCVCFIDWQKAFDRVTWTKLMQILKATGIDWRERRLISKQYMDQKVKVRLDRGQTRSVQIGNCLLKEVIEGKIKGRIEVTRRRGRRRRTLLDDLGDRRGYSHLKEEALDRITWWNCFGRCCGPVV